MSAAAPARGRQTDKKKHHVMIVGDGFAGLGCAQRLADVEDIRAAVAAAQPSKAEG